MSGATSGRPEDVAACAGVSLDVVCSATADDVRHAYADTSAAVVVQVATQEPALYWKAGGRYYLDDPSFGPVAAIDDLRYSQELGLYDVRVFGEGR